MNATLRNLLPLSIALFLGGFSPLAAQSQNSCPCCTEVYRQFDFWLGDWQAVDTAGNVLGHNHIVRMQDSCVIQENWSSARGPYTGTSYNFYHSGEKVWKQLWLDNQGGYLELEGKFEDGNMVLWSQSLTDQQGRSYRNRITWTPLDDGRVRQHWQVTYDDGDTWQTAFDGYYERE